MSQHQRTTVFWFSVCVSALFCGGNVCRGQTVGDEQSEQWFVKKSDWHGYDRLHFEVANRTAYLVAPKQAAPGKPWVWRARFPDYHWEMDAALLAKGFHVAYVDVSGMFGSPQAMEIGDALYQFVTRERGLAAVACLEGVSRGGLFVYNWTARHPERVACIYCDTPVLDFKSWPGGKGTGLGSEAAWRQCLNEYELNADQVESFRNNPVDRAELIAEARIPILHIVSENDRVVPPQENTYLLQKRLEKAGHRFEVISVPKGTARSHGHHFQHPEPDRVVKFIVRHALRGK